MLQVVTCMVSLLFVLTACGTEKVYDNGGGYAQEPAPAAPAPSEATEDGGTGKPSYADVQPLVKVSCAPCHASDSFLKSEAAWKASSAAARIANKTMPPPASSQGRSLKQEDRETLLQTF